MFPEWIEVFAAGTWVDSQGNPRDWTLDDLNEIVSSYDGKNKPAPIVIGHPETDSPAYGWIDALKVEGEKLLAKPGQLVEEFVDWVKRGLYKKISVAIYPDLTLKHVGFLGGAAPAVKGLKPVSFGDKKAAWTFEMETSLYIKDGESTPPGHEKTEGVTNNTHKGGSTMDKFKEFLAKMIAMFTEAQKDLSGGDAHADTGLKFTEAEVQAREAKAKKDAEGAHFAETEKLRKEKEESDRKLREIEAKARKDGIHAFCEGLLQKGQLIPAWTKMGIEEFLFNLDTGESITFAEGQEKSRSQWFMDFVSELPKVVTFSKVTPTDGPNAGGSAGEKLSALTKKKMEEKKDLSYAAAFSEVQKENPELAKELLEEIKPSKSS